MRWSVLMLLVACGSSGSSSSPPSSGGRTAIVYELDLEAAVVERAEEVRRGIAASLDDAGMTARVTVGIDNVIVIALSSPTEQSRVESMVRGDYADTLEVVECLPPTQGVICRRVAASFAMAIKKSALDNAANTIRERLVASKARNPSVVTKGDTIIVEIDAETSTAIIERTGKLDFKAVDNNAEYMKKLFAHVGHERGTATDPAALAVDIRTEVDSWKADESDRQQDYYLVAYDREADLSVQDARRAGCTAAATRDRGVVRCPLSGRWVIGRYLTELAQTDPSFRVPDDREIGYERVVPPAAAKDRRPYWRTYYLERSPPLTGTSIASAKASRLPDSDDPVVLVKFNRHGAKVFGDLTAALVGKKLALILDDTIKSAPIINGAIRGGEATLTMGGVDAAAQEREINEVVMILSTGSLPAPLRAVSRRSW